MGMMIKGDVKGYDYKIFHQRFEADELLQKDEIITKLHRHFQNHIDNTYLKASDILESLHN